MKKLNRTASLLLAAVAGLGLSLNASANSSEPPTGGSGYAPPIKPQSDAAERAIEKFKVDKGLTVSLWAAEPLLCNPNALCQDEKGNIYVAETNRYHGGVIDIREAPTWLEEDIACRTVADRIKMIQKHESDARGQEANHAPESERIIMLQDTTGSGRADKATVFADGFDKPADGLGSGVLARNGHVYYTCIPALYDLQDTKGVGRADKKTVLSSGYGVRYAFLGHDLHGLVFGPDGRLYFSIGDRGANVDQTPDNRHVENIESGCVFRCNPDGTGLEVFATGLRNPQELRFDQFGNLFTGDNNPDKGDPARWVYIVEDGDSGWRESYQSAEGLQNGGPWMAEQIWANEDHNNAAYINPCVQGLGAGPSGLAYYPGTGLPEKYANHFFLCDFRGGPNNSGVWSLLNKPKGAGFELTREDGKPVGQGDIEHNSIIYHVLATDVEYGVDGGLYVSDWINGWGRPNAGRIYHVYDESKKSDPLVLETRQIIAQGMSQRPADERLRLLSHPDMRVRQEAQFALAEAGDASISALTGVALHGEKLVGRLHAIWGLGQIATKTGKADAVAGLVPLLDDAETDVRCQASKILSDAKVEAAASSLRKMLSDVNDRVRYFGAMGLGKLGDKSSVAAIFKVVRENEDKDPTLRFGCVDALAKLNDVGALSAAGMDASPSVRLAAVLALRRLKSPNVADFLGDADRSVVLEAARAINDLPIEAALPKLAAVVEKPAIGDGKNGCAEKPIGGPGPHGTGGPAEWVWWRAVNANYRLGTADAAKRLAAFAVRDDVPEKIRAEALFDLGDWEKPSARDRVSNLWRPLEPRDPAVARAAAATVVSALISEAPEKVKVAATKLAGEYGIGDPATLSAMVENKKLDSSVRSAALLSLAKSKDQGRTDAAVKAALADSNASLRATAIGVLGSADGGAERLKSLMATGTISDKQATLAALGKVTGPGTPIADEVLTQWVEKLMSHQVPPELQLDVLDAAAEQKKDSLKAKVKEYDAARDAKDSLAEWRECETGGDAQAGRKIFLEKAEVSCIRCHAAEGIGGIVGPRLDGVGKRQTREYLLESIVFPNAKIAPGFETVVVTLNNGKHKTGIFKSETEKELELFNPDLEPENQKIVIEKADIKSRDRGPSAMPEGLWRALTKHQLRDVVEFLASLKTEPKQETLKHGK